MFFILLHFLEAKNFLLIPYSPTFFTLTSSASFYTYYRATACPSGPNAGVTGQQGMEEDHVFTGYSFCSL